MSVSVENKKQCEEISMKIRQAKSQEISEIMKIYDTARQFMKEHGNPTQWNPGYPSKEMWRKIADKAIFMCAKKRKPWQEYLCSAWSQTLLIIIFMKASG